MKRLLAVLALVAVVGISSFFVGSSSPRPNAYVVNARPTISWGVQIWNAQGQLVAQNYIYNKTVVNSGLTQMATFFGNTKATSLTGFVYMITSNTTSVGATDTSCPLPNTSKHGLTIYDTTANYAYAGSGATTYTTYGTWTISYTGTYTITIYMACLTASSTNAATFLADETLLNGATGYVLQNGYVLKLSLTVTI